MHSVLCKFMTMLVLQEKKDDKRNSLLQGDLFLASRVLEGTPEGITVKT